MKFTINLKKNLLIKICKPQDKPIVANAIVLRLMTKPLIKLEMMHQKKNLIRMILQIQTSRICLFSFLTSSHH
jgi:hypothetical protein